jgi:hypothetical protein
VLHLTISLLQVPEVGCTEMKRFTKWLGGSKAWDEVDHSPEEQPMPVLLFDAENAIQPDRASSLAQGYEVEALSRNPLLTKIMMVRDPMVRLATSFVVRCGGLGEGRE